MNGVIEAKPVPAATEELAEFECVVVAIEDELHELACRCLELLADERVETFPPGHWLG
jgi:hypothetical protein